VTTKLRCLLLDDELPGLAYLKMLCGQIPQLEIVKSFNDPEKLLAEIGTLEFDLLISDIEMPGIDGLTLAQSVKDKLVIFATAYKEYAADAFNIDAVDYVTKPIKPERLRIAVDKAIERFKKPKAAEQYLTINTDKGKALLYFDQIFYIKSSETDSRDKQVWLADGSLVTLKNINFDTLLKQFPEGSFCRVNKKEIVAMKAVQFFSHNEITLKILGKSMKPQSVLLSETYRADFLGKVKT
jgi:DNA-binding LytR/AlgR family response regulator